MVKGKKAKRLTKKSKKSKHKASGKNKLRRPLKKKGGPAAKIRLFTRNRLSNSPKKASAIVRKAVGMEKKGEQIDLELQQINDLLSQAYARQLLIDIGGENTLAMIRNFSDKINDEELATRLKIRISDVRATLNKLHNEGLVNYSRDRDNESGWYSYSWSLNKERIRVWLDEHTKNQKVNMGSEGDHYFCPSCGIETLTAFEKAVEGGFKCQNCSRSLEFIDESKASELFETNKERVFVKK